jgi:hypothetical protein
MFKILTLSISLFCFFSLVAEAAHQKDVRKMTCAEAFDLVRANPKGIVLTYGYSDKAGRLYSKFYPMACHQSKYENVHRAYVETLDRDSCYIGYTCR